MTRRLAGLVLMLLPALALAQGVAPTLVVTDPSGRSEHLLIQQVAIDVRIVGYLAETRMTLTFANPQGRDLEGDLYFPLPEKATVSGYALDIRGQMVDGVVVEREKARVVFEEIVRQRIDPGLVEWTRGNVFRTRVFPIPSRGTRKVMVRFVSELAGDARGCSYTLPLGFSRPVGEASIRVVVEQEPERPRVERDAGLGLEFGRWKQSWVAEKTVQNVRLEQSLMVALPKGERERVWVERDATGQHYFYVAGFPPQPRASMPPVPRRVTVLWDASGSRGPADHGPELEVVRGYIARLAAARIEVELVTFSNAVEPARRLVVEGGDASALVAALRSVAYDGGTQLGVLPPPATARPDLYLLFSDGLATYGTAEPGAFAAPVYAFSVSPAANQALLRRLAAASGGAFVDLLVEGPGEAVAAIGRPQTRLAEVATDGAGVTALRPTAPAGVGERVLVSGKVLPGTTEVTLRFDRGGKALDTQRFAVDTVAASDGTLVRTFWAQQRLAELAVFPRRNARELVKLGRAYGLVTPGTSLMVLESVDQYVRYEIEPPDSQPVWQQQYAAFRRNSAKDATDRTQAHLDTLLRMWQERLAWWGTDFVARLEAQRRATPPPVAVAAAPPTRSVARATAQPVEIPESAPPSPGEFQEEVSVVGGDVHAEGDGVEGGVEGGVAGGIPGGVAGDDDAPIASGYSAPTQLSAASKHDREGSARRQPQPPTIQLQAWDPETPYLDDLREAPDTHLEAVYLALRAKHGSSTGFFLDCADLFLERKDRPRALRVLSNLAELELEDAGLWRILGTRLAQLDELDASQQAFEAVLDMRPEEPQSHRDLALVLARRGAYQRAVELLTHVVMTEWPRFVGIELIALEELNAMLPNARAAGVAAPALDPRLLKILDVDLRVVLTWDADLTDMDLWVVEPSGEKAMYNHNRTAAGGLVSRDFTQGYGPEEYLIRRAQPGAYRIQVDYYGTSARKILGPVTLQVEMITNYGRPNEERRARTLRLASAKEVVDVGEVAFGTPK